MWKQIFYYVFAIAATVVTFLNNITIEVIIIVFVVVAIIAVFVNVVIFLLPLLFYKIQ